MHIALMGVAAALANGLVFPLFSVYLAKMIGILIDLQLGTGSQSEANRQALAFFIIAIADFFINFIQHGAFGIVADRLTKRIRI